MAIEDEEAIVLRGMIVGTDGRNEGNGAVPALPRNQNVEEMARTLMNIDREMNNDGEAEVPTGIKGVIGVKLQLEMHILCA